MTPIRYDEPKRVWVDNGHVLVEGRDGTVLMMTPEVALHLSRKLGAAGGESLINKVMDGDS